MTTMRERLMNDQTLIRYCSNDAVRATIIDAILDALMNPSDGMLIAGAQALRDYYYEVSDHAEHKGKGDWIETDFAEAQVIHTAMVQAAKEGK